MRCLSRSLLPIATSIIIGLAAVACSGGGAEVKVDRNSISGTAAPATQANLPTAEPLVLASSDVLRFSAERSRQIESSRGTFQAKFWMGGSSLGMTGAYVFQAPDKMYMTIDMFGQTEELLLLLPDFYIRIPNQGWFVVNGTAAGINWNAFKKYVEQRGPVDYSALTQQLQDLTQLPDEVLDGVPYLHYRGQLDMSKAINDLPSGLIDPSVLARVSGTLKPIDVEVWLDKKTYLPHRTDMNMQFSASADTPSISMQMSMLSEGFNEPVSIPAPPADAKPISSLQP
jgi:hypothetical protein